MKKLRDGDRIRFHSDGQIMECDFTNMTFDVMKTVNDFYDEVERQIGETGQKWFFLVNYYNCRIMAEAWISFAHRGKKLNLAYSLGTARFAVSPDTSEAILEQSQSHQFDPNLFESRDAALAYLRELRAKVPDAEFQSTITKQPDPPGRPIAERVSFHCDLDIMEVDFSGVSFERSRDVDEFYGVIDEKLAETGKKWFFLVSYRDCVILPEAWYRWATWSKRLNSSYSLGTVRFSPQEETTEAIESRARDQDAAPNVVSTREEAFAKLAEMRKALSE
jgi:hypothetical protein